MARLCVKCKEYITIYESFLGHKRLSLFENDHDKHPLVTLDVGEVGKYTNVNKEYDQLLPSSI